jgi:hypothetical protein
MSATIDAERFSQYFNGCSVIQVPGFTYPVSKFSQIEYIKRSEIIFGSYNFFPLRSKLSIWRTCFLFCSLQVITILPVIKQRAAF